MRLDRDLIQGIIEREDSAWDELYTRYGKKLRRHLLRTVRDEAAAEDLLQEVLLRVWKNAGQWRGEGSLQGWLYRIGTNLALNHIRAVGRRRQTPLELNDGRDEDEGRAPGWMVDEAARGADAVLEQAEERRLLRGCVEKLSEEKREVLHMVYDAEMEVRQVAAELEIPEGTVKSRLYHARREVAAEWRTIKREWEDL